MKTYRLLALAFLTALMIILQIFNNVIGFPTGFGMTVDLVGVPILLAFLIFGYAEALEVSFLLALILSLIASTGYIGATMKFAATLPMFLIPAIYLMAMKKKFDFGRICALLLFGIIVTVLIFGVGALGGLFADKDKGIIVGIVPVVAIAIVSYLLLLLWNRYGKGIDMSSLRLMRNAVPVLLLAITARGVAMIIANFYFAGPLFFKISPDQFVGMIEGVDFLTFGKGVPFYVLIFFWNAVQGLLEFAVAWIIAFKFGFFEKYGSP
jgi:riboflavin transporter FmnP